jgi:4,5-dihydroxyphthalate decarboxylase
MMGTDYWAYGIAPNRHVLQAFARYAPAQHLTTDLPAPEDLFAEEVRQDFII